MTHHLMPNLDLRRRARQLEPGLITDAADNDPSGIATYSQAGAQSEGTATVLAIVSVAALVGLAGIVAELSAAKVPGAPRALPHVLFALATVAGSWTLLPVMFTQIYARAYCGTVPCRG